MKHFLILFFLISVQSYGQNFSQQDFWKGYTVHDIEGKEIRYKRQDFIKFKENALILFQFQELMSMKTGEVKIEIVIDTFKISKTNLKDKYTLTNATDTLSLVQNSSSEFCIFYPKFYLTFKKMNNSKTTEASLKDCEKFVIESTFREYNVKTQKEDNIKRTYQKNGQAIYSDSRTNWESMYKIVDFEGYIFIKGITSAPLLVRRIEKDKIVCTEVDYRFEPEEVELRKE